MLARGVTRALTFRGPAHIWGDMGPQLRKADLTVANLECVLATSGQPFEPRRTYYFRADPDLAGAALLAAGIDVVSLANNHVLDYGPDALQETLKRLDDLKIHHAGAGVRLGEASAPGFLQVGDVRMAFFSAADHFADYAAEPGKPGIHLIAIDARDTENDPLWTAVQNARAKADLVIYSLHWGPNLRQHPTEEFVAFAHRLIDAGVDIVHGHSAHVFQGIEWYRQGLILYDTGDLMDDYAVDNTMHNDQQFLFSVMIQKDEILRLELLPFRIDHTRLQRVDGEEYGIMAERMIALSRPFGTAFVLQSKRLFSYPPPRGR